jgi:hypothetical protein
MLTVYNRTKKSAPPMTCFVLPPLPTSTQAQYTPTSLAHSHPLLQIHAVHICCVHLQPQRHTCVCYALQERCCHDYYFHQSYCHPRSPQLQTHPEQCGQQMFKNGRSIHQIQQDEHSPCPSPHAIATFKEHFIMGLATVNRNCLLQLWDEFLHQVKLTLNLFSVSCPDPSKSANKEVHSPYDFNKSSIAPIGTKGPSATTPLSMPAGRRTKLMHSTLAPPQSTIGVCDSTCQPNDVALWTHGIFTQAIAQYQLFQLLISQSLQHATCSRHYKIPSQLQPAKPPSAVRLSVTYVPLSIQSMGLSAIDRNCNVLPLRFDDVPNFCPCCVYLSSILNVAKNIRTLIILIISSKNQ